MQKFLSIPVLNEDNQLLALDGLVLVEQASTSTVVFHYQSGAIATVTHEVMAVNNEEVRNKFQDAILTVLKQSWQHPSIQVSLSGLTDAGGGAVTISGIEFSIVVPNS